MTIFLSNIDVGIIEECGTDFEFKTKISFPYIHQCRAWDCLNPIQDGDDFILDENEYGRFHTYCSKACSEKQDIDYPREAIYSASEEQCCAKDCSTSLNFHEIYFVVPGWSGFACSEKCATAQYNLVWGSDDGGREQTAQREIDRDYWHLKRSRWK